MPSDIAQQVLALLHRAPAKSARILFPGPSLRSANLGDAELTVACTTAILVAAVPIHVAVIHDAGSCPPDARRLADNPEWDRDAQLMHAVWRHGAVLLHNRRLWYPRGLQYQLDWWPNMAHADRLLFHTGSSSAALHVAWLITSENAVLDLWGLDFCGQQRADDAPYRGPYADLGFNVLRQRFIALIATLRDAYGERVCRFLGAWNGLPPGECRLLPGNGGTLHVYSNAVPIPDHHRPALHVALLDPLAVEAALDAVRVARAQGFAGGQHPWEDHGPTTTR